MAGAEVRYRMGLLAIVLAGVVLRLAGLNWDEGRGLHPDEANLVRAALTLLVDGRLIPEFHAYNDLALWLPRLVSLPFCAIDDSVCLTLTARFVSAMMSVAAIPLAAGLARQLAGNMAGRPAGLATAAVFATSASLVQWAHFGTTESALVLWLLALWRLAALWLAGRLTDGRMALWSGALLGLGFGLKTTAAVLAIVPLTALVLAGRPEARRLRTLAAAIALAAVMALASTPSIWLAPGDWLAVMRFENGVVSGATPVFWTAQFRGVAHGWYDLGQLWSATSGAGLLLAVAGLVLLPRQGWRALAPALVFAALYALVAFGWQAKFFRYLAPLLPVALVLAGLGIGRLVSQPARQLPMSLALAGLGLMAMAGLDQAAAYLRPDPRITVEAALLARSDPADLVAVEPHDLAQTGTRTRLTLPLTDIGIGPEALSGPLARAGWLVIASRRNWAVLPRQTDAPPVICAFYAGLAGGDLGFVPILRVRRDGPFGRVFAPSLSVEETRTVFDRPEVILFRNMDRLPEAELRLRLGAATPPQDCATKTLEQAWSRDR